MQGDIAPLTKSRAAIILFTLLKGHSDILKASKHETIFQRRETTWRQNGEGTKANPIATKKQNRAFVFTLRPLLSLGLPNANDHLSSSLEEETKATRLSRRNRSRVRQK